MRKLFSATTVFGLVFFFSCFSLNAQDVSFENAVVISDYTAYDQDYFENNSTHRMISAVQVNTSKYPVYISSKIFQKDYRLYFLQDWTEYTFVLPFDQDRGAPAPGTVWEEDYQFYVDENENQSRDATEAEFSLSLPSGSLQKLDIPSQVEVEGTMQPKVTWKAVEDADFYRVRLLPLDDANELNMNVLLDQSEVIPDDGSKSYSYEYKGKAFEENASTLAMIIEAYDTLNDDLNSQIINRSRYVTQFSSEKCASLENDFSIFVPCLQFEKKSFWLELEYAGKDSEGNLLWKLKDLGVN